VKSVRANGWISCGVAVERTDVTNAVATTLNQRPSGTLVHVNLCLALPNRNTVTHLFT